ncbi:winged helix-turn-helix domain-containing protein [Flavobacteriaceae bacterium 3-367]|uniref:winged helix-turn-helix transcriptional regulator n=1 Tax=Eudoraea algarum TaxID=3417568 RepID=UPI003268C717
MSESFYIGDYLIQPFLNKISSNGKEWKVEPKIMAVLMVLVQGQGKVISKEILLHKVWGNTVVVDMVVTRAISELRRILDTKNAEVSVIETISKKGYRLAVAVKNGEGRVRAVSVLKPMVVLPLVLVLLAVMTLLYTFDRSPKKVADPIKKYKLEPLTSLVGWEYHPTVSPEAKAVAFVRKKNTEYQICTKTFGGDKLKVLVRSEHPLLAPAWSPKNNKIAYYKNTKGVVTICTISTYGGEERELMRTKASVAGLAWSSNGKSLAYTDNDSISNQPAIYSYSLDTGARVKLTNPSQNVYGDSNPRYSPNGEYLAFIRTIGEGNQDILILELASGSERKVTSLGSSVFGFDWKTDSSFILSSNFSGSVSIWEGSIRNKEVDMVPIGVNYQYPEINGNRLVLEKWTQSVDIWTSRINDTLSNDIPRIESTKWDLHPSFSKDGKKVVFVSNRSGGYDLWVKVLDSPQVKKITSLKTSLIGNPKWSPNDKLIAFDSRHGGATSIYLKNMDTENIFSFTDDEGNDLAPRWSKNGDWIYFTSDRNGSWQIWKKALDGMDKPVQITSKGGYYVQESPDGKSIFYTKFNQNGIWKMELASQKETLYLEDLVASDYGNWQVISSGIYYIKRNSGTPQNSQIMHYGFETKVHKEILTPQKYIPTFDTALTVSPDENWVLYGQINSYDGDLISVQNF